MAFVLAEFQVLAHDFHSEYLAVSEQWHRASLPESFVCEYLFEHIVN